MKRSLQAFTLFFVLTILSVSAQTVSAQTEEVMITAVQGGPMIVRQGQEMPAAVGMSCQKNDVLKTPPSCMVDVAINGLAGCRVLPGSEVALSETRSSQMSVQIASGNAILNLAKLPSQSSFTLETPTAVATVRGTQFWGRVDMQNKQMAGTTFAVKEGVVEVFDKQVLKTYMLRPNQALDIPLEPTSTPSIRPAAKEELKALEQATAIKISA